MLDAHTTIELSLLPSVNVVGVIDRCCVLQVYVSVYADGPTRVLRFADEKATALLEDQQSILDLAARLKQASFQASPAAATCLVSPVVATFERLTNMANPEFGLTIAVLCVCESIKA